MSTLRDEEPHVSAVCRDGSVWMLPVEAFDGFITAWMAGRAFWQGVNLWGSSVIIKLADITGVIVSTEESMAAIAADNEERKRRDVLTGGD